MTRFAGEKTRRRDFVRRQLVPMTDPAIIEINEGTVTLTKDWEAALEKARELGGENRANEEQIEKVKRQREAFNADIQPDEVPEIVVGDELHQPWPLHPDGCGCRECSERFGRVIGEHVEDCRCAKCYAAPKEADRGRVVRVDKDRRRPRRRLLQRPRPRPRRRAPSWLRLRAQKPTPAQEGPAAVVAIRPQANSPAEDWHSHPLDCECDNCLYPEPRYARPYPGSG